MTLQGVSQLRGDRVYMQNLSGEGFRENFGPGFEFVTVIFLQAGM
jgi:hypothetical protein